jgi:hypothetical protein
VAVVFAVWTPLELLNSYMDAFVFSEDDLRRSFRFSAFLTNFFGIIATAGVLFIGHEALTGQTATFTVAVSTGLASWGRMWWTRFLTALAILFGFLLLIVPGIYLIVRLSLVEPVAVQERISGSRAMRRSFALTHGHFWILFRLCLAQIAIVMLAMISFGLPIVFIPALDHWLISAAAFLAVDVVNAFVAIALVTAYFHLRSQQAA